MSAPWAGPQPEWRIACEDCQVIGRPGEVVKALTDRLALDDFLAEHCPRPSVTARHRLVLLSPDEIDRDVPRPGWRPRPVYGPPLPGEAQDVACPICTYSVGGSGPRDPVVWKRTDAGDPFLFCRGCAFTWGRGADADRHRMLLRSLGRPDA